MENKNSVVNLLLPNSQITTSNIDLMSIFSGDSASPSSNPGEEDRAPIKRKRLTQACDASSEEKGKVQW